MQVAALQMVSGASVQGNLDAARLLLESAAAQGAELAVLPEYFCLMGLKETDKLGAQESPGQGPIQDFLADSARKFKVWIAGGTVPLRAGDEQHVRNSSLVYAPTGQCAARYDKIHLFRFDNGQEQYDESRVIERGAAPVTFDLPSVDGHIYRVGLSICYDLRFPELYRALKADLLVVPSAFTVTTGRAHWEVLLRARAIENLAYVVAAAQGGEHENGRRTWGQSLIADPWGEIVAQHAQGPAVVLGEVLASRLQAVRQQLPALNHGVL
ncbi:MAG TPA: carbon-nitrogen hydrolase family protein [Polaromonas sp.]|uniref:carbon-nitrogen hydrolase family protein n=1 Tax=Polaromonas sp. TaxID=1869339 RepID=UPI002D3C5962|nr:carbon-nitrogen hydrolase family protein [Polaromonas sp.]HYW56969.1 carbon-nitrogen hydrolase family protein [Polaromonas sp.]